MMYYMNDVLSVIFINTGDWSNGMIGVSKTFGGSSILSSPALKKSRNVDFSIVSGFLFLQEKYLSNQNGNQTYVRMKSTQDKRIDDMDKSKDNRKTELSRTQLEARRKRLRKKQMRRLIALIIEFIGAILLVVLVIVVCQKCAHNQDSETGNNDVIMDRTMEDSEADTENLSDTELDEQDAADVPEDHSIDEIIDNLDSYDNIYQYYGDSICDDGKMVVCIDAGHGGKDGGCEGLNGRLEKNDTLSMAMALKPELEALGVTVYMTRTEDTFPPLESRPLYANSVDADVMISFHRNTYPGKEVVHGVEGWISYKDAEVSRQLAEKLLAALESVGISKNRGIKTGSQNNAKEDYVINSVSSMPSVVMEMGFVTAADDNENLDTKRAEYARVMAEAIVEFIQSNQ